VDVHVHRISNRMGLLRTKTPLDTEMTLRKILPKRYWQSWNRFLVSFGQTICKPVGPQCNGCPLHPHCDRVGVK
jgi:endonuclease-3